MISKEQMGNLINGLYKLLKENDSSLISETVNSLEGGLNNKLFRAYIGYGSLSFNTVYNVMKQTAKLINDYYGNIPQGEEGDEKWQELIEVSENIRKGAAYEETNVYINFYVTNIIVALMEVFEQECKQRTENE